MSSGVDVGSRCLVCGATDAYQRKDGRVGVCNLCGWDLETGLRVSQSNVPEVTPEMLAVGIACVIDTNRFPEERNSMVIAMYRVMELIRREGAGSS